MTTRLAWATPKEPQVNGLTVCVVDAKGAVIDERVWVREGPNRWNLHRSGLWRFGSLLRLAEEVGGEVVAVEFRCPSGCGTVETAPRWMRTGHCARCNADTGSMPNKSGGNAQPAQGS